MLCYVMLCYVMLCYVCMYVCMYVFMYVCMYLFIYLFIYFLHAPSYSRVVFHFSLFYPVLSHVVSLSGFVSFGLGFIFLYFTLPLPYLTLPYLTQPYLTLPYLTLNLHTVSIFILP